MTHFALPTDFEPFTEAPVHEWLLRKTCGDPFWGDEGWCGQQAWNLPHQLSTVILDACRPLAQRGYDLNPAVLLAWIEAEQPVFYIRAPSQPEDSRCVEWCVGYGATDSHDISKFAGGRKQLRNLAWHLSNGMHNKASAPYGYGKAYAGETVTVDGVQYGPLSQLEGVVWSYATDKVSLVRRCQRVVAITQELAALAPSPPPPDTRLRVIVKDTNEVLPYRVAAVHPEQGKCYVERVKA